MSARHVLAGEAELQFHLPARFARDGINAVRIELTPLDVYRVQFFRIGRGLRLTVVADLEDVYCDQLRDVFERTTGLVTRL
jgi:hypothetical protein